MPLQGHQTVLRSFMVFPEICNQCGYRGVFNQDALYDQCWFVCLVCGYRAWVTAHRDLKNNRPRRLSRGGWPVDIVLTGRPGTEFTGRLLQRAI